MKLLIVEDNHIQADDLSATLKDAFPNAIIDHVDTEHGFIEYIKRIETAPSEKPNVILMDVMVRWTHPSTDMAVPPEEVVREKHYRAGLRCQRYLASRESMRRIRVILYTVLEGDDLANELESLPPNVTYMRKDKNYEPLIRLIRRSISNHHPK